MLPADRSTLKILPAYPNVAIFLLTLTYISLELCDLRVLWIILTVVEVVKAGCAVITATGLKELFQFRWQSSVAVLSMECKTIG